MAFGSTRSPHLNLPVCIAIAVTQHHRLVICNQHKLVSPSHGAGSLRRRPSCWVSVAAAARSGGDHSSVLPWWEVERLFCEGICSREEKGRFTQSPLTHPSQHGHAAALESHTVPSLSFLSCFSSGNLVMCLQQCCVY